MKHLVAAAVAVSVLGTSVLGTAPAYGQEEAAKPEPKPEAKPEPQAPAAEPAPAEAVKPAEPATAEPAATPAKPAEPATTQAAAATPTAKRAGTTAANATGTATTSRGVAGATDDRYSLLSLEPGAPQVSALPGGVTPAFGSPSLRVTDWRFDFHGFVMLPLRVGLNERKNPGPDQKTLVLHTPPQIPGDFETFEYTGAVPDPWVQLNFSYGNRDVTATVIVAARSVTTASGYFNPPDQVGINDAFLTFRIPGTDSFSGRFDVGAFANNYGPMGEHDLGRYNTPLIVRVGGVGFTGTGRFDLGDAELVFETGFMGQLNKAPLGVEPAGWNGFADPNVGTSFAPHAHAAVGFGGMAQLGVHAVHAFVQDDRATPTTQPDGSISMLGGDVRLTLGRFGHLYGGIASTKADQARAVSGVIRVLNAPGGPGLMEEYLGPASGGDGDLLTFGGQYDLSLGNLLRSPARFEGDGPDFIASLFSIATNVSSPDPDYDATTKLKYGSELTYSMLRWLAASFRYDRVIPDTSDATQTTAIVSPRVIFHTDWNSQDQVVLQYSRVLSGSGATVKSGYPPERDPTIEPDKHVLSLSASMWW